jgi:hypothetical protein
MGDYPRHAKDTIAHSFGGGFDFKFLNSFFKPTTAHYAIL